MDIFPKIANTQETTILSGLQNWNALSRVEEFVEDAWRRNRFLHNNLHDTNSSGVQCLGQTLVEYLSEKLKKDELKMTNCVPQQSALKNKKPRILNFLMDPKGVIPNDKSFCDKSQTKQLLNVRQSFREDSSNGNEKKKLLKKFKYVPKDKINQKTLSQQRYLTEGKAYDLPWSKTGHSLDTVLGRFSQSSNSDTSLEFCLSSVSKKESLGLRLPRRYIIGRHFYNLFRTPMNETSEHKLNSLPENHQLKPTSRRNGAFDSSFSKGTIFSYAPNSATYKSPHGFGRLYRRELKYSPRQSARAQKSAKPKAKKIKLRQRHVCLDYEASADETTVNGSQIDGRSCSSSVSSFKPLRTALKKNTREKCLESSKRCVRFDCNPRVYKDALHTKRKYVQRPKLPVKDELSVAVTESKTKNHKNWRSLVSGNSFENRSRSSSSERPSSSTALESVSYEDWYKLPSYAKQKNCNDGTMNEPRSSSRRPLVVSMRKQS